MIYCFLTTLGTKPPPCLPLPHLWCPTRINFRSSFLFCLPLPPLGHTLRVCPPMKNGSISCFHPRTISVYVLVTRHQEPLLHNCAHDINMLFCLIVLKTEISCLRPWRIFVRLPLQLLCKSLDVNNLIELVCHIWLRTNIRQSHNNNWNSILFAVLTPVYICKWIACLQAIQILLIGVRQSLGNLITSLLLYSCILVVPANRYITPGDGDFSILRISN